MQGISLLSFEDSRCILAAIAQPNEVKRKEILKKGLKNVIEVMCGGKCKHLKWNKLSISKI